MLKDVNWSDDRDYKTGSEDEPLLFYLEGLSNSTELNLLLGYFSSAAINLLSVGFATFISKGGKLRMVINHLLSEKDKDALINAEDPTQSTKVFDLNDIVSLGQVLDEYDTHFFECLAYLIAQKRIEIKVIKPKNGKGISHYKSGVFSDGIDSVGYKASCNFTLFGLSENLEELEAFLSWENGRSNKLIRKQMKSINKYFSEEDTDVDYLSVSEIEVAIKDKFSKKDLNELLIQEEELLNKKMRLTSNPKLKHKIHDLFNEIETIRKAPKFPYPEGPREYQKQAYQNWVSNGYKGIFAMATGTGKTITSLNCVLEEYKKTGVYQVLILVPTITLGNQWVKEAESFNLKNIYTVSSKVQWKKDVTTMLSNLKRLNKSFVIISTYASFIKDNFQAILPLMPTNAILIADEGHNIASYNIRKLLPNIKLEKLIGLSATPKRIYDEEGTKEMETFFNDTEPYVYSFPMEKAIAENILCRYDYFPHLVTLNKDEFEEYVILTKKLAKYFDAESKKFREGAEMILLQRKRVIQKAVNKLKATRDILTKEFERKGKLEYTFIYTPEGIVNDNYEVDEELEDDVKIINLYTREIALIDEKIKVNKYVSQMEHKEEILEQFKNGEIHVLASMKCLDEGVDIPRAEFAIFCSSTGNPRQFIQRRGRILRKHKNKIKATIHDLIVIPEGNLETFDIEKNLVERELERVMYFASLSENSLYTEDLFKDICEKYNLNIYTIQTNLRTV